MYLPKRKGATSPFPRLGFRFLGSEVRAQAHGPMSAQSTKGCDGGPVLQLMYTKLSFRSPGVIVKKGAGCICWLVKLLLRANLSNTTAKCYTLSFPEVEKLDSFLSCSC